MNSHTCILLLTLLLVAPLFATAKGKDIDNCPQLELLRGRDGRDGRDGLAGAAGPQGAKGERGDPGGPQGPRGLTGAVGKPGATGPQGAKGERGPGGPQGPRGLTGAVGTPGARGPAGPPRPRSGGVTYVRWGKSSCPSVTGTELVYAGRAAGTVWNKPGGGSNYLCLPNTPQYTLRYRSGSQRYSEIYGTEYEAPLVGSPSHNVPCAVCSTSTRVGVLMIPAWTSCPTGWTREYYGYLMSAPDNHHYRTSFECVDKDQESVPHSQANSPAAVFYHVEANCNHGNGLPCPPYNNYKELNCVVCTK